MRPGVGGGPYHSAAFRGRRRGWDRFCKSCCVDLPQVPGETIIRGWSRSPSRQNGASREGWSAGGASGFPEGLASALVLSPITALLVIVPNPKMPNLQLFGLGKASHLPPSFCVLTCLMGQGRGLPSDYKLEVKSSYRVYLCKSEACLHLPQLLLSPACPSLVHSQRKQGPEEARTLQRLHSPGNGTPLMAHSGLFSCTPWGCPIICGAQHGMQIVLEL